MSPSPSLLHTSTCGTRKLPWVGGDAPSPWGCYVKDAPCTRGTPSTSLHPSDSQVTGGGTPMEKVSLDQHQHNESEPEGRSAVERSRPPARSCLEDFLRICCMISWRGDFCPAAGDSEAKRPQCAKKAWLPNLRGRLRHPLHPGLRGANQTTVPLLGNISQKTDTEPPV